MRMRTACALVLLLLVSSIPALAWGPGAHAAIAIGVADQMGVTPSQEYLLLQAIYGASAPDLAWLANESLASALGTATHLDPGYREPWDRAAWWSRVQRSFAWGWLTHNEVWGADYYAHLADPVAGVSPGYVERRAAALSGLTGVPADTCHYYVEAAVDLLLDQQCPSLGLGELLAKAAASRDPQVPSLLVRCYADVQGSGLLKVLGVEAAHRTYLSAYGAALALPTGADDAALAAGMAALYGLTFQQSAACLATAKALCQQKDAEYYNALTATIGDIAGAAEWP